MNQKKDFEYSQKNIETALNLRWVSKLLRGIYPTGLTWKGQNLGRKVEVIYMDEPCNACSKVNLDTSSKI